MKRHLWKDDSACLGMEVNDFFDNYEEKLEVRAEVDAICKECPVRRLCLANGISGKEYGVWGGIYLENGEISREFSKHKSKKDWADTWQYLTTDK